MLDWLIDNKEWLFSGSGVAALTALFALIGRIRRRAKNNFSERDPRNHVFRGEHLADAFTLGVVLARVIRTVEIKGASAISGQSWQTIRTLTVKLDVDQFFLGTNSPVSLIHNFPSISHHIEKKLQAETDPRLRNAFMFGNFIALSSLAPSIAERNEALARAEVFARETSLSGTFLKNLFAQLRSIPSGSGASGNMEYLIYAVLDEIQRL